MGSWMAHYVLGYLTASLLLSVADCARKTERVCRPEQRTSDKQVGNAERFVIVANSVSEFSVLTNCTVIEGSLRIYWMTETKEADFQNISFPDLVEITDYLMVYRISGLVSLGSLFPNLRIIRGQHLLFTYALLVYELEDLESIGLSNLVVIQNGLVLFEKNPSLCYVDTLNWEHIVRNPLGGDITAFRQNKVPAQCQQVENCLQSCPVDDSREQNDYGEHRLCWDENNCQKVPPACKRECSNECVSQLGPCCHAECVGGCTGPEATDCTACRNVFHEGVCLPRCPPQLVKLSERRCITKESCRKLDVNARPRLWWKIHNDSCLHTCPPGFIENVDDKNLCTACNGSCLKVCSGGSIESVPQSKKFKGCTKINGHLEIRIIGAGGRGIPELDENLGEITEVTQYVKVVRSNDLTSLSFLRKLAVIGGVRKDKEKYALHIFENQNLESLWDLGINQNLTIREGTLFMHTNRKLCYKEIEKFINNTNFLQAYTITDVDVSKTSNGNNGNCEDQVLNVTVAPCLTSSSCYDVEWTPYVAQDPRQVLGYAINYRQVEENEVVTTQRSGTGSEGQDKWTIADSWLTDSKDGSTRLSENIDIMPFVRYALYISTHMVSSISAGAGGKSPIIYFRTNPDYPYPPADVVVKPHPKLGSRALQVSWKPPKKPNGIVTEYVVYYRRQKLKPVKNRDYCTQQSVHSFRKQQLPEVSQPSNLSPVENHTEVNGACACNCGSVKPKPSPEQSIDKMEYQLILSYAVENMLHDLVFVKGPQDYSKGKKRSVADSRTAKDRSFAERKRRNAADDAAGRKAHLDNEDIPKLAYVRLNNSVDLFDLEPARYYSIEVSACHDYDVLNERKLCSLRAMSGGSTLKDDTLDVIRNDSLSLDVRPASNGIGYVLRLTWDEPVEFNETNGQILAYEVEVLHTIDGKPEPPVIACMNQTTFNENNNSYWKEVKAGNYSFRVRLVSSVGLLGPWTPYRNFIGLHTAEDIWAAPWLIAVVAISVLTVVVAAIVTGFCVYSRKKSENQIPRDILYASMNPDYWDANEVYIPDEWEVNRSQIKMLHDLGQGSFGMVYEGLASGFRTLPDGAEFRVAVKTVNENASIRDRISFLKEASVMKAFSCPHIVKLLGVVSKGQPTLVVMELMSNGDLKNYLRMHRPDEPDNNGRQPPTIKQIWRMAAEIADGMAYLAAKKFVHRDLAARNCMVAEDTTVKIGDFGMTRDIYETDYYRKGSKGLLPVRWMAPESLKDGVFTSYSDVWSYGVVLWEMATLAAQPYQGLSNEQVLKYVIDENMMEAPEGCPEKLFQLMLRCWQYRPKGRLSFAGILEHLKHDMHVEMPNDFWYFEHGGALAHQSEEDMSESEDGEGSYGGASTTGRRSKSEAVQGRPATAAKQTSQMLTSGYSSLTRTASAAGCSSAALTDKVVNGCVSQPLLSSSRDVAGYNTDEDEEHDSDSCASSSVYDVTESGNVVHNEGPAAQRGPGAAAPDVQYGWLRSGNTGTGQAQVVPSSYCARTASPMTTAQSVADRSSVADGSVVNGIMEEIPSSYLGRPALPCGIPLNFSRSGSSKDSSRSHSSTKSSCNGSANGHATYLPRAAEC